MFGRLLVVAGLTLMVLLPTAAAAQEDNYPVTTKSTTPTCDPNDPSDAEVCGTVVTVSQGGSTLPFTGGDVALLTVLGLGAAGAGIGLVWFGRRTESTSDSTA